MKRQQAGDTKRESSWRAAVPPWVRRRMGEQSALFRHFAVRWYIYLPLIIGYGWALQHICINWTPSLPYYVVYVQKNVPLQRGDLVVFRFEGAEFANHLKGQRFFKRIAGIPGDEISVRDRNVFIGGVPVGLARSRTLDGHALDPIEPGIIPERHFYVQGTHDMSFDSRYRVNGLIGAGQVIAKATVIF